MKGKIYLKGFIFLIILSCAQRPIPKRLSVPKPLPAPPEQRGKLGQVEKRVQVPDAPLQWLPSRTKAIKQWQELKEELKQYKTLAVLTDPGPLETTRDVPATDLNKQIYAFIKEASPETKVLVRNRITLDFIFKERGEIPYRYKLKPTGQTDIFGRPTFIPEEHPLNTEWLDKKGRLKGAEAILAVGRYIPGDDILLRLYQRQQTKCTPLKKTFAEKISEARKILSQSAEEVDRELYLQFRYELSLMLREWHQALDKPCPSNINEVTCKRCVQSYYKVWNRLARCVKDGRCAMAPQLHVAKGGHIGMIKDPSFVIPSGCEDILGWDIIKEMLRVGREAISKVIKIIDPKWGSEATRVGAMELLVDLGNQFCREKERPIWPSELRKQRYRPERISARFCPPELRRIPAKYLAQADKKLKDLIQELKKSFSGKWVIKDGEYRVKGYGPAYQLAEFVPHTIPSEKIREFRKWLERLEQCPLDRPDDVLAILLVDVGTSAVKFYDLFLTTELTKE